MVVWNDECCSLCSLCSRLRELQSVCRVVSTGFWGRFPRRQKWTWRPSHVFIRVTNFRHAGVGEGDGELVWEPGMVQSCGDFHAHDHGGFQHPVQHPRHHPGVDRVHQHRPHEVRAPVQDPAHRLRRRGARQYAPPLLLKSKVSPPSLFLTSSLLF
jgi:hypothetical protein